nr:MAG TPA: hypothetical protein [Bacteriophage sp.]
MLEGVRYVPGRPVLVTPTRVFLRSKPFFRCFQPMPCLFNDSNICIYTTNSNLLYS